jgi:hypothetical protein
MDRDPAGVIAAGNPGQVRVNGETDDVALEGYFRHAGSALQLHHLDPAVYPGSDEMTSAGGEATSEHRAPVTDDLGRIRSALHLPEMHPPLEIGRSQHRSIGTEAAGESGSAGTAEGLHLHTRPGIPQPNRAVGAG